MTDSAGIKLNQQQLSFNYKSFDSSSKLADGSPPNGITCDSTKRHDVVMLKELTSGSPNSLDQSLSKLKETDKDCCSQGALIQIYAVSIIIATGVTIALVLEISLVGTLVFIKGVVSDHERCTLLSKEVLGEGGSSVDAAIAGALCLGVVHPHVSGVGGGGVMLIHDIRHNETRVINFQGSAPYNLSEEMLQNASGVKSGLLVGVPGMLMGLHHAHNLYGRLSWEDVVSRAAHLAREGFSVSQSLAVAISKVEGEKLPGHFRDLFIPNGRVLSPGSYLKTPGVAEVLEAGLLSFYQGTISQEIEDEVRANGGILSREDIHNYSAEVQLPIKGYYNDFIIQVPPPPSAGVALIVALNLLEGLHLGANVTETQTYHWINEALTAALSTAGGMGDPKYTTSASELVSIMMNKSHAEFLHQMTNSTSPSDHNSTLHSLPTELLTGQVVVMGPDDLVVSVASSLNGPFGSRIITQSGIILNSLILDFLWPNQSRGQPQANQKNRVGSGKRPLTFLMPTVMVPAWNRCGTYMALSSSGGQNRLREITKILVGVLFLHKKKNDSFSLGGLKLEPHRLLVDSKKVSR